tara:strand:+ start:159 stop:530 length:372 start_codon:yes stop_codon:yes gene_type:complete
VPFEWLLGFFHCLQYQSVSIVISQDLYKEDLDKATQAASPIRGISPAALLLPPGVLVDEFSVLADKPIALVRELFIYPAPSLYNVAMLCPQLHHEFCEPLFSITKLARQRRILSGHVWKASAH